MNDEPRRRRAAMRAAGRLLSGARPRTMRERLAALAGAGGLDDLPDCYGGGRSTFSAVEADAADTRPARGHGPAVTRGH